MLYAFMHAITGSLVSKLEEVPFSNIPITVISSLALFISFFSLILYDENLMEFASVFPFSSAFTMPSLILSGDVTKNQIISSLLILFATILLLAFIAIKIYSITILHYGNRIRLKNLFK